jgi:excisionase family DNA binding protein
VRNFCCEHQVAIYREGEQAERRELILHEAASRLGVGKMIIVRFVRDGPLPARQVGVGAPYVIHEDDLDLRQCVARSRTAAQYQSTLGKKVCLSNKMARCCIMSLAQPSRANEAKMAMLTDPLVGRKLKEEGTVEAAVGRGSRRPRRQQTEVAGRRAPDEQAACFSRRSPRDRRAARANPRD